MEKHLQRLNQLKVMLTTSQFYEEVLKFFFDHFGENSDFLNLGEAVNHETLKQILLFTAKQALKDQGIQMSQNLFVQVKDLQFIHGIAMINDYIMNMFYFEDIDTGLCALTNSLQKGETILVRFSCFNPEKEITPSAN